MAKQQARGKLRKEREDGRNGRRQGGGRREGGQEEERTDPLYAYITPARPATNEVV